MSYTPYDSHNHSSPTLEGKKNSSFLHPNLRSSNVFYDYDYSYKNDMHNPRLLSAVKNDKFNPSSRDERVQNRSTYEKAPSERSERPSTAFNSAQKAWDTQSNNGDNDYYQAPASRSQRGSVPNVRAGGPTRAKDFESLSTVNEEPFGVNSRATKTTRGGPGKYCLDCVNSSLADRQKCKNEAFKAKDTQHMKEWTAEEARKSAYNYDKARQENTIARKHEVESKAHSGYHDYKKLYGKNEPEIEGGIVIDAIFDKHEERTKQNKMNERSLRNYNFDKMVDKQANKDVERLDRLTSEHSSLQVNENFVNRYLPTDNTIVRDLKDQMESDADRKARNKEAEQRRDQELLEANRIAMAKEKQAKQEKVENYRRMLSDQVEARAQLKTSEKEKTKVDNAKDKYYAQKCADDHNAGIQTEEATKQRNKQMFMNSLKEHQQESGYRKMYHDKKKTKLQGDGVTLQLGKKAEMDNCAGCNKTKETNQLTHFDHKK